jgi:uncharacterized protein (TIGR00304 family)
LDSGLTNAIFTLGLLLVLAGFAIAFVAGILMALRQTRGARAKGGGVVLIGPFPIVFGSDARTVRTLILLSILLMVAVLVVMLLPALVR